MMFDFMTNFRKDALTDIVELDGKFYYIDSCYTLDHGYETMIFPCDSNGNVTSWNELYVEWYDDESSMITKHGELVNNLRNVL